MFFSGISQIFDNLGRSAILGTIAVWWFSLCLFKILPAPLAAMLIAMVVNVVYTAYSTVGDEYESKKMYLHQYREFKYRGIIHDRTSNRKDCSTRLL